MGVIDTQQTLTNHELTNGMEVTAFVSPDGPSLLVDSSDTDNERDRWLCGSMCITSDTRVHAPKALYN